MEIAAWSPPRSYALRGVAMGTAFLSEIRCLPDGAGTRIEMEIQMTPLTWGARCFAPLLTLMSKLMVKTCAKDLVDIARHAERGLPGPNPEAQHP